MNVLLICVDGLKPLLGCYASPLVKNLNLDRFAQRSVRFDMVFCNQAGCFPWFFATKPAVFLPETF
jgi:iduronate 2-sulfatase